MEPGYRIAGRYELLECLGQGRIGRVFRALDHDGGGAIVAIKLPHAHHSRRPEFAARFHRQFVTGLRPIHPSLVRCLDTGEFNGLPFLVTELVEGKAIDKWFRETDGDFERLAQVLERLLEALAAAHHNRLVHQELKPSNILVTPTEEIRLLDFGMAGRLEDQLRGNEHLVSSLAYLSPEQALGGRGDERSDLYALGAILYALVAGRPMFAMDSPPGLLLCHINDDPTPLSRLRADVPLWLERLVGRLTQKNPERRPASAREVVAAVRRRQQAVPVQTVRQDLWWAREEELAALSQRLHDLKSRGPAAGGCLWMSGPLGCGLSALLGKAREKARQLGLASLEVAVNEPRITLLHFLRHPQLGPLLGRGSGSEVERAAAQVVALAHDAPLVVFVDNFERADEEVAQIVAEIGRLGESGPILLIVAAEEGCALTSRPKACQEMQLKGWSREVCVAYVEELLWAPPPPEMGQWLWRVSQGSPAFLRLLLEWLEGRHFRVETGEIFWTNPPTQETPESMESLLQSFLQAQGPDFVELLGVGACLGESFELNLLRATNLKDDTQLEQLLERATRSGWLEESWEGGVPAYRFAHPCRHRAALQTVPPRRQRRYHLLAGAFRERARRQVADWEKAAYHYELAQEWELALRTVVKVMQAAADQENWPEARYWMRRCRNWGQELPTHLRADAVFPSPWGNFGWTGRLESTACLHFLAAQLRQLGHLEEARWYLQAAFEEGLENDVHRLLENRLLLALCQDPGESGYGEQVDRLLNEVVRLSRSHKLDQMAALASALRLTLRPATGGAPELKPDFEGFRAPE